MPQRTSKKNFKIGKIFAFFSVDGSKNEGLLGMQMGDAWRPFIAADREMLDNLRPMARRIGKELKKKIIIVEFTKRKEIEVIGDE